jgi:dCMP deaminase
MSDQARPSWDEFFIAIAVIYSSRGTCDRLRTACVLVKNKRIVGAGYNGSIAGQTTCDESGHLIVNNHCVRTLHGEQNALANSRGADLQEATAYIVGTPCIGCIKELLQHNITRIVYVGYYDNGHGAEYARDFCKKSNCSLEQFTADPEEVSSIFGKVFERLRGPGGIFQNKQIKKITSQEEQKS